MHTRSSVAAREKDPDNGYPPCRRRTGTGDTKRGREASGENKRDSRTDRDAERELADEPEPDLDADEESDER
ncbi:hypothetical protein [Halocalculus aciditolerans]|uniref:hypothetical protein n=1 Tax=Halocalculus aciditolerans TaxID=1383812 RepID=UPI00166B5BD1|nr:hypothetical protein [Halocalculus aciditolerans]